MKPKPQLEALEDRCLPSVVAVLAFQSQVPALHAQFEQVVPQVQTAFNRFVASVAPALTPAQLAYADTLEAELPAILEQWFSDAVTSQENALLQLGTTLQPQQVYPQASYMPPLRQRMPPFIITHPAPVEPIAE